MKRRCQALTVSKPIHRCPMPAVVMFGGRHLCGVHERVARAGRDRIQVAARIAAARGTAGAYSIWDNDRTKFDRDDLREAYLCGATAAFNQIVAYIDRRSDQQKNRKRAAACLLMIGILEAMPRPAGWPGGAPAGKAES